MSHKSKHRHRSHGSPIAKSTAINHSERIVENDSHPMALPRRKLAKCFRRIDRILDKVDEAFNGEPFLPIPPELPENMQRFQALIWAQNLCLNCHRKCLDLWMRTYGLKRDDDWTRISVEQAKLQQRKHKTEKHFRK